jgi:hypothetical protein
MKFNTSWGSIWPGKDGSLKIGDDGSRYSGGRGVKGVDFPDSQEGFKIPDNSRPNT